MCTSTYFIQTEYKIIEPSYYTEEIIKTLIVIIIRPIKFIILISR